jgi:hypothetical protein
MKHVRTQCLHRTVKNALLASLLGGFGAVHSHAQLSFNSGSTGADGALNVTSNTTKALPADGVFNYTTITVASGATLKFTTNTLNTPVHLLATGDILINGTIDVSASGAKSGGPGGFDGGKSAYGSLPSGDGYGPGGGRGTAAGSYATTGSQGGTTYGSPLLIPLVGGSGGGGGSRIDAGGGGAILLASSTRVDLSGSVLATGVLRYYGYGAGTGAGSGGAVRIVAPVVAGRGTVNVSGGMDTWNNIGAGGVGRIRIDCMDRRSLALGLSGALTIGANMVALPAVTPRLDVIQVGTNTIPVGTLPPLFFMFPQPPGIASNQVVNVKVQAADFGGNVPIRIALIPDSGTSTTYDTNIDNTISPATVTLPVTVPVNVPVQINAWTR